MKLVIILTNGTGIDLSPVDRWGVTPLSDSKPHPAVYNFLLSKGAKLGQPRIEIISHKRSLSNNEYRLFYAALYNDMVMMDALE